MVPVHRVAGRQSARAGLVSLGDPRALDPALVGAKAAALARARAAGLPVLEGLVLPTSASSAAAAAGAWASLGARPLVARSSSVGEDGVHQSMAGVFTSVTDIADRAALERAVAEVLASARIASPDGALPGHPPAPMAVLIQPFLAAAVGGVAFGIDPLTGSGQHLRVATSTEGPGAVVAGRSTEEAVLTWQGRLVEGSTSLDLHQRRRVARLARRAARLFGGPQDVEFAFDAEGRLWLLQARPVTAVHEPRRSSPTFGPGPLAETFPDALSALEIELWVEPLREAVRRALGVMGVSRRRLARSPVMVAPGGRVALDLDLAALASAEGGWRRVLSPSRAVRRMVVAWRTGRLATALPGLAAEMIVAADADLASVPALSGLDDHSLLCLLAPGSERLVSLHGYEVLLGWLAEPGETRAAASVALEELARARRQGLSDPETVARHPSVLTLYPPRIGPPPSLGPTPTPSPRATRNGTGSGRPGAEAAAAREALRLRVRWYQELLGRTATELARRMAEGGSVADPGLVRHMTLAELADAVTTGLVPVDLDDRARPGPGAPLPARFRLGARGEVLAVAPVAGAAQGVSPGRAQGMVAHPNGLVPEPGSILVVQALDPKLAPLLSRAGAVVSESGTALSHLAILAREAGIPVVVGYPQATSRLAPGTTVTVDGSTGEVEVAPSPIEAVPGGEDR